MAIKDCIICGRSFEAKHSKSLNCSEECARIRKLETRSANRKANPKKWANIYKKQHESMSCARRERRNNRKRQHYFENKERLRAQSLQYYQDNLEACRERKRRERIYNADVLRERDKARYKADPEKRHYALVQANTDKRLSTSIHAALADAREYFPELFDQKGSEP